MVRELPDELIECLVNLGASARYAERDDLFQRFRDIGSGAFMRLAPHHWGEVTGALNPSELAALIMALTAIERRYPNCRAGSVSPVIWLFRQLSKRSDSDLSELADWVLANTDNPYLPFGSFNYKAQSVSELQDLSKLAVRRAETRRSAEGQRQTDAKDRKAAELHSASSLRSLDGTRRRLRLCCGVVLIFMPSMSKARPQSKLLTHWAFRCCWIQLVLSGSGLLSSNSRAMRNHARALMPRTYQTSFAVLPIGRDHADGVIRRAKDRLHNHFPGDVDRSLRWRSHPIRVGDNVGRAPRSVSFGRGER
jgi:hypothetical protein